VLTNNSRLLYTLASKQKRFCLAPAALSAGGWDMRACSCFLMWFVSLGPVYFECLIDFKILSFCARIPNGSEGGPGAAWAESLIDCKVWKQELLV